MPLPISKNQVRRLGSRLRDAAVPTEEDLELLSDVLAVYDEALASALSRLQEEGITASERLKNSGTIIEKLRRGPPPTLPEIQDLAGLRVVLDDDDGRLEQDALRDVVCSLFADGSRTPRVYDRRENPSRGYRAVHVVVTVDDLPVEIQLRTVWQHRWAELFEKLADHVGRDIRYKDGPPELPRLSGDQMGDVGVEQVRVLVTTLVELGLAVADLISTLEEARDEYADASVRQVGWSSVDSFLATLTDSLDALRTLPGVGS